ncbi:DUF721 domain-containing protein [Candidatus Symbiothrix dinenymphae]|uniref:DUF721 domain-containing protein n=1 Tax=Candidatus Symbiothrix dinenymphae TaxID=467085 RepID=UPI0006C30858|nr:DUF721 domain-containing protein [Candidatus Symbiothrix dinenymphae]GAP72650.1 hypothetical protein SAMD00024442_381_1 [Candidatus Symbiothrix dinenymphae]
MKRVSTQSIASVLNEFLEARPDMANKIAEARIISHWNTMSPAITRYTSAVYIRNRTLYVTLTSAVLKTELMMRREQLLITLNKEADRNVIDTIVFC